MEFSVEYSRLRDELTASDVEREDTPIALGTSDLHTREDEQHTDTQREEELTTREDTLGIRELSTSDAIRKDSGVDRGEFSRVNRKLSHDQFDKLKFLACSKHSKGDIRDAKGVLDIYEQLKPAYGSDASSVLNTMLEIVQSSNSGTDLQSGIFQNSDLEWRVQLIRYADVPGVVDYMYKLHSEKLGRYEVTSPVMLFQHMIDRGIITFRDEVIFLEMETFVKYRRKIKTIKITLAVFAAIALISIAGLLLSLIKYTSTADIVITNNNNKTLYHKNKNLTVLVGTAFDLKHYDKFKVSLRTAATDYNATMCQTQCSPDDTMSSTIMQRPLNYSYMISIEEDFFWAYLHFNDLTSSYTPSNFYVLQGSVIVFEVEPPALPSSSVITLNIFTDVERCVTYTMDSTSTPCTSLNLSSLNSFTATHTTQSDDFFCVVATFPDVNAEYHYSVTGLVKQYHDVNYLTEHNLCAYNNSLKQDGDYARLNNSLERPLKSIFSPGIQHTCVFVTISGSCDYKRCKYHLNGTFFATNFNPNVVAVSATAVSIFSSFFVFLIVLCLYVLFLKFKLSKTHPTNEDIVL